MTKQELIDRYKIEHDQHLRNEIKWEAVVEKDPTNDLAKVALGYAQTNRAAYSNFITDLESLS